MNDLLIAIAAERKRLDELRPFSPKALAALDHYDDLELTYTSNAIEGNKLSPVETTLVIEKKGITVAGKPLKDHLEALDHYQCRSLRAGIGKAELQDHGERHPQSAQGRNRALQNAQAGVFSYARRGRIPGTNQALHAIA